MAMGFENVPEEFVSKTAFFDYKTPVTELMPKLEKLGTIIILKNKEYAGVLDGRTMSRSGKPSVSKKEAAGKYALKVPMIGRETSISKAIHDFYSTGVKALPYYDSGKITGVVHRDSMLKAILSMHMLSSSTAGELMSTPLLAIDADKSLDEALSIMRHNRVNRLVVTSSGKFLGIITYRDIMGYSSRISQRGSTPMEATTTRKGTVLEIADKNANSIGHNESIDEAIRIMARKGVSSLLVMRGGKPAGMLTVKDILSAASMQSNVEASEGIIISGLEGSMKQYEEEVRAEVEATVDKINRFTKFDVESISIHVRKHKVRNYEIKARAWLEKAGAVSVFAEGFSLEFTLKDVLSKLYKTIENRKEIVYALRKSAESQFDRDEKEE